MIKNNTPIEKYKIKGKTIYVKREDLCTQSPGPPFSKCRGLHTKLKNLKKEGIMIVGYVETPISMAGWGVAWLAEKLKMKAVIFDPQYVCEPPETIEIHRKQWKRFHPDIIPIKAGRTCINQYICKKILKEKYGEKSLMLPIGIPFEETIEETAMEFKRTLKQITPDITIICVGSGTICAGILRGMSSNDKLIGIMAYDKNLRKKEKSIWYKSGKKKDGLFKSGIKFQLFNPGWKYTEQAKIDSPFPTHSYYDLKAWQWTIENIKKLEGIVLFWNIGSEV